MKFKYYLRGCGLGIILTVLVLGISLAMRGGVMTDEKVIARAGELGMVMPGDEDSGETVTSTEELESTQVSSTEETEELQDTTEAGTETADESQAESVVSKVRASAALSNEIPDEPSDTTDTASETEEKKTVTVRVQKGDVCREVAENLESKGLVSDAEEFRKYMQKKGYDNRICIGSFTIKQGMTYEEIAKILVGNT